MLAELSEIHQNFLFSSGYTQRTAQWFATAISLMAEWCEANDKPQDPSQWTPLIIHSYLAYLINTPGSKGKPRSKSTINSYYRALHSFCNHLREDLHLIENDPFLGMKQPKMENVLKPRLSNDDFNALLAAAQAGQQPLRDHALLLFLYDTGCRREEVRSLIRDNVFFREREAHVIGKGEKSRLVAFVSETALAMQKYDVKKRNKDCPYFFQTDQGTQLTPNGIVEILRRNGNRAGVHANAHKFRHTFATEVIRSGASTVVAQNLMGHTKPDITERYAKLLNSDVLHMHAQFSPVANRKKRP